MSQDDVDSVGSGNDSTVEEQKDERSPDTSLETAEAANAQGGRDEPDGGRGLDFILDIPLEVSVELGRTQMLVNDLLRLGQGSIVELTKLADESMDVYVNRKLFARGEVVVINEKFGIRLTDIISPIERVKKLA
ncbi:MAG: flagellar motor switch protein FliN [Deltaproteobacteria bacterium]|nr:flagellar motor switch protein FliN [Deltaproteobacteria bacterium]